MTGVAKRRVGLPSGELAFVDAGDPEAPPVLLLTGHLTSSFQWRHLVSMLSPWMRVLAPDLPGRGDSPLVADADLSLAGQTRVVRELLGELAIDRVAAVGFAFGGGIAQLLALEGGVEALVLIDSIAFDAWPSERMREIQQGLRIADQERVRGWVAGAFDVGMSHRERLAPQDLDECLRPFTGEDGVRAFVRVLSAIDGLGLEGTETGLAALEIPALVLWGEDDPFLDCATAERLGDVLPRASVALLPGCGHFVMEDAPETVSPLLFQWLRSQYLKMDHRHEEAGPVMVYLGRRPPGEGGEQE
jgi:pimeloyl-ACP methyl ester carboxylesterase